MNSFIYKLDSWIRFFKKMIQHQFLHWGGEGELLKTLQMQREMLHTLNNLNEVDINAYRLTLFCDLETRSMGYQIVCIHSQDNTDESISKYFHQIINDQTRKYFQDFERRTSEFLAIYEADILDQSGNFIEETEEK